MGETFVDNNSFRSRSSLNNDWFNAIDLYTTALRHMNCMTYEAHF